MNYLAIIPARGGSKGIPKKNIRLFAGKPLLSYAIAEGKKSAYVSRIVVSTESDEVARVAKKCGAEVPFLRPAEFAGDKSPVVLAITHLLEKLAADEGYHTDAIILLQPTSPLRTAEDIDGTVRLMLARNAPAAVTVCRTEQLVFTKDASDALRLESNPAFLVSTNRQQLPPAYKFDGSMVYVIRTDVFLREKTFVPEGTVGYEIPRWRAVDLDEPQDFVTGELIFKHRKVLGSRIKKFK